MALAPLADELTTLLRAATAARDELASGALLDMGGFESRLTQLCTAMGKQPGAADLRPLLRALENELGLLSAAIEARLAAPDRQSDEAGPAHSAPEGA